jgi:hypothetical protein
VSYEYLDRTAEALVAGPGSIRPCTDLLDRVAHEGLQDPDELVAYREALSCIAYVVMLRILHERGISDPDALCKIPYDTQRYCASPLNFPEWLFTAASRKGGSYAYFRVAADTGVRRWYGKLKKKHRYRAETTLSSAHNAVAPEADDPDETLQEIVQALLGQLHDPDDRTIARNLDKSLRELEPLVNLGRTTIGVRRKRIIGIARQLARVLPRRPTRLT